MGPAHPYSADGWPSKAHGNSCIQPRCRLLTYRLDIRYFTPLWAVVPYHAATIHSAPSQPCLVLPVREKPDLTLPRQPEHSSPFRAIPRPAVTCQPCPFFPSTTFPRQPRQVCPCLDLSCLPRPLRSMLTNQPYHVPPRHISPHRDRPAFPRPTVSGRSLPRQPIACILQIQNQFLYSAPLPLHMGNGGSISFKP